MTAKEQLDKYMIVFDEFINLYKSKPGIVKIRLDDFLLKYITVLIDKSKYNDSLPNTFKGLEIEIYDAYESLEAMEQTLELLDEKSKELFKEEYTIHKLLLDEYEELNKDIIKYTSIGE